ncbi:hypothetical protein K438DRAFT_1981382 [Mycena galopus ATCC 62051]|nr:hypothetical protein K438DRAFT_1981382 [Mycena galopus ATCC 62051]
MTALRTTARKQMLSAVALRIFGDATNRIGGFTTAQDMPKSKPMSRRVARKHTKRLRANATPDNETQENGIAMAEPLPARDADDQLSSPPIHPLLADMYRTTPRPIPKMIIRTLPIPSPPPKKFHGPFEACGREDLLVEEEPRTWEEDAWGVVYNTGDFAGSVVGPVRVITRWAAANSPAVVQFIYG